MEILDYPDDFSTYGRRKEHTFFGRGLPNINTPSPLPPVPVGMPPGLSALSSAPPRMDSGGSAQDYSTIGPESGPTVGGLYGNNVVGEMTTGFPTAVHAGVAPGTPGNWGAIPGNLAQFVTSPLLSAVMAVANPNVRGIPSALSYAYDAIAGLFSGEKSSRLDQGFQGLNMGDFGLGFADKAAEGAYAMGFTDTGPAGLSMDASQGAYDMGFTDTSGLAWGDSGGGWGSAGSSDAWARGGLINGPGGGLDDLVQASINGKRAARLSDGEFVFPADAVSALGDGSTKMGAKKLSHMIQGIRRSKGLPSRPIPIANVGLNGLL